MMGVMFSRFCRICGSWWAVWEGRVRFLWKLCYQGMIVCGFDLWMLIDVVSFARSFKGSVRFGRAAMLYI